MGSVCVIRGQTFGCGGAALHCYRPNSSQPAKIFDPPCISNRRQPRQQRSFFRPTKQTKQHENQLHYFVLLECFVGQNSISAKLAAKVIRAFSAAVLGVYESRGDAPRLLMRRRLWRSTFDHCHCHSPRRTRDRRSLFVSGHLALRH